MIMDLLFTCRRACQGRDLDPEALARFLDRTAPPWIRPRHVMLWASVIASAGGAGRVLNRPVPNASGNSEIRESRP